MFPHTFSRGLVSTLVCIPSVLPTGFFSPLTWWDMDSGTRPLLSPLSPKSHPNPLLAPHHQDKDVELRPVRLRGHLEGQAVGAIGALPALPLHEAPEHAAAGTARAPPGHL